MKIVILGGVALVAIGFTAGWIGKATIEHSRCAYLDEGYQSFRGSIAQLPSDLIVNLPSDPRDNSNKVLSNIYECWSKKPYYSATHPLQLRDIKRKSSKELYYVFDPAGISDTELVFSVGQDGVVTKASVLSMMGSPP